MQLKKPAAENSRNKSRQMSTETDRPTTDRFELHSPLPLMGLVLEQREEQRHGARESHVPSSNEGQ